MRKYFQDRKLNQKQVETRTDRHTKQSKDGSKETIEHVVKVEKCVTLHDRIQSAFAEAKRAYKAELLSQGQSLYKRWLTSDYTDLDCVKSRQREFIELLDTRSELLPQWYGFASLDTFLQYEKACIKGTSYDLLKFCHKRPLTAELCRKFYGNGRGISARNMRIALRHIGWDIDTAQQKETVLEKLQQPDPMDAIVHYEHGKGFTRHSPATYPLSAADEQILNLNIHPLCASNSNVFLSYLQNCVETRGTSKVLLTPTIQQILTCILVLWNVPQAERPFKLLPWPSNVTVQRIQRRLRSQFPFCHLGFFGKYHSQEEEEHEEKDVAFTHFAECTVVIASTTYTEIWLEVSLLTQIPELRGILQKQFSSDLAIECDYRAGGITDVQQFRDVHFSTPELKMIIDLQSKLESQSAVATSTCG